MWVKCKSSVCFISNVSTIKHSCCICKLQLWHLKKKCHLEAAHTPSTCSKRWKTTGQPLSWTFPGTCIQPNSRERSSRFNSKHLSLSLRPESNIIISSLCRWKHNSCLFYSHGWLKMVVCMEKQPLPPRALQRAATGMTRCTGTWETQLTLLPWQPSQRITVLQHIRPPTTLAASEICCSSLLSQWWDVLVVTLGF